MVAATGANVRAIDHDRTRRDIAIGGARVMLELETRGPEHIEAIREQLKRHGYNFEVPALG
jgi:threonine dehydratase